LKRSILFVSSPFLFLSLGFLIKLKSPRIIQYWKEGESRSFIQLNKSSLFSLWAGP
jgi:hypothetical protein